MTDDADRPAPVPQAVEDVEHAVEGVLVQGAEALVDEEGLKLHPAASAVTTSARPRASASEVTKLSPPDSVAGSRSTPVQASRIRRPSPPPDLLRSPAVRPRLCSRR
ncbi:hypothetical protein ACFQX6_63440 [Streptosporangium lutulentum]